ncbi:unnamed protein product [Debaryomyces tyrocola]|nr:unnamed protein product [Debaryomyces tyrocola]
MDNPFMDITDISVTATYGTGQEIGLEINGFIKNLDLYRIIIIYKKLKFNIKNLEAFIDELTFAYLEFQNNKNLLSLDQIIVNLKRNTRFIKPKNFQERTDNYSNKFDNNKKKQLKKNNRYENRSQNSSKNNDEN